MNLIFTTLWLIGMTVSCASLGVHFGDQTMHILWGFIGGFFGFLIAILIGLVLEVQKDGTV